MKAINFVVCLCMAFMLSTFNSLAAGEDFKSFLHKFTSSASFQYSRIKFPLKSPIVLLQDDGETEQTFPFTRDKWALLKDVSQKRKEEFTSHVLPGMNLPIKNLRRGMTSRSPRSALCLS